MSYSNPEDEAESGDEVGYLNIVLRVEGNTLDPDEITRLLGRQPTLSVRRGELCHVGDSMAVEPAGRWVLGLPHSSEWDIDDAIITLLGPLPVDPTVWASVRALGSVDFLITITKLSWCEYFTLSAATMGRLGALDIPLKFQVFDEIDEDE